MSKKRRLSFMEEVTRRTGLKVLMDRDVSETLLSLGIEVCQKGF
jgi:hypothetical protein